MSARWMQRRINLPNHNSRSVLLGYHQDPRRRGTAYFVRFMNRRVKTDLLLSREAMDALVELYAAARENEVNAEMKTLRWVVTKVEPPQEETDHGQSSPDDD